MMSEENVLKALEHCRKYGSLCGQDCSGHYEYTDDLEDIIRANNHRADCPYGKCKTGCVVTLIDDVIDILKKQKEAICKLQKFIKSGTEMVGGKISKFIIYDEKGPVIRCKDCRYFEQKNCYVDIGRGVQFLAGGDVPACTKWGDGDCFTNPDGYCYLAERRENK